MTATHSTAEISPVRVAIASAELTLQRIDARDYVVDVYNTAIDAGDVAGADDALRMLGLLDGAHHLAGRGNRR